MDQIQGRLPDFIVIGATKGGTTSLDFYLSLHPEIQMARPKEPRFFVDEPPPVGGWSLGTEWYRGLFRSDKKICGESSPSYSAWPAVEGVVEKMHSLIPKAKLIYLVREPLDRLKSSYLMSVRYRGLIRSFSEYLETDQAARDSSRYGSQLRNFLRFYPLEQIMVVETADLETKRNETLERIFCFLGVSPDFRSPLFSHKRHVAAWHAYPNAAGRRVLNSRLMMLLGHRLSKPIFYHFRNTLMYFFATPRPSTSLTANEYQILMDELSCEMNLLRELTGLPLESLGD